MNIRSRLFKTLNKFSKIFQKININKMKPVERVRRNNPSSIRRTKVIEPSHFEYLPTDVRKEILSNMGCKQLLNTKVTNPHLSNLITPEIVNAAINRGYPRRSNRAKIFTEKDFIDEDHVSVTNLLKFFPSGQEREFEMTEDDEDDIQYILENSGYDLDFNEENNFSMIRSILIRTANNIILENLKDSNKYPNDIVKGDLVFIGKSGVYIFDGCEIIKVQKNNYPFNDQFQVIKDNVPIKYWDTDRIFDKYSKAYVNFDHRPYRGKMIRNLKSVQDSNNLYTFRTEFPANNKIYTINILSQTSQENVQNVINNLVRLFEQQKNYIPFTIGDGEDTLYLYFTPAPNEYYPKKSF
jgi:hypothetical protein